MRLSGKKTNKQITNNNNKKQVNPERGLKGKNLYIVKTLVHGAGMLRKSRDKRDPSHTRRSSCPWEGERGGWLHVNQ